MTPDDKKRIDEDISRIKIELQTITEKIEHIQCIINSSNNSEHENDLLF